MLHTEAIEDWLKIPGNDHMNVGGREEGFPRGKHRMNWTSIWDWKREYPLLDRVMKDDVGQILKNITMGENGGIRNWCARGMKYPRELNMWLLFLSGLEWRTVRGWNSCLIEGNTKTDEGGYSPRYRSNKLLCPRTAKRAANKWLRTHKPEEMFSRGYRAYTFTVHDGNKYSSNARAGIHRDWEEITKKLHEGRKKGLWAAHFHNHEISVRSILKKEIYPHTHVIVWVKGELDQEEISTHLTPYRVAHSSAVFTEAGEDFKRFIDYLHGIYNLAHVYQQEWCEESAEELNRETKNLLEEILDIYWGRRKTGGGNLPAAKKEWQEDRLPESHKKSRMKLLKTL
jgi:hypothetical protein